MSIRPRPPAVKACGNDDDDGDGPDPAALFAELIDHWTAGRVAECVPIRNALAACGWRVEPKCRPGSSRKAVAR